MKQLYPFAFLAAFIPSAIQSQSVTDAAVQLEATIQLAPPTITISWPGNATTTQYNVYRKLKTSSNWGSPLTTLSGTINQYVDNTVSSGVSYEYRVDRTGSGYNGHGYINAGMEIPVTENRGNLILVVDSTFIGSLAAEISRLMDDLEGDGWNVKRINVLRAGTVTNVKAKIVSVYNQDPTNTQALFILGHVPVPYSGDINPDGHPDHLGAWPTDSYYADIDGTWTDVGPATTTVSPPRTQNLPGDGKFDQSVLPTPVELQTGRVDLFNLPAFAQTETQLMQAYLNKDHAYRKKLITAQKRAVVDDNFGFMSNEAFAASGYNNFSSLVGNANITANDYFTLMGSGSYLWSYGCGPGSYNSAGGIGVTSNFAASNLQGIFTMLFGSYFGDWDVQNSFLRAPLAQGWMLTCSWSGRPHHQYHHMALGETVGYGMMITQNQQNPNYFPNIYGITGNWIHNGLMGDPSLRNDVISPVSNVVASVSGNNCNISWSPSTEPGLLGYNVYMKNDSNQTYVRVNNSLVTTTTFTDVCIKYKGIYKYMVRAVKLENTPAGTYYNMSEGIADTAYNNNNNMVHANFSYYLNYGNYVVFNNLSYYGTNYSWNFGPGVSNATSPTYTFPANGMYTVTLIASNACYSDTITKVINVLDVGLQEMNLDESSLSIYPNPAKNFFQAEVQSMNDGKLQIFTSTGELVFEQKTLQPKMKVDVSQLSKGIYFVKLSDKDDKSVTKKILVD